MTPLVRRLLPLLTAAGLVLLVVAGTALAGGGAASHRNDGTAQVLERRQAPGQAAGANADETEESVDPQAFVDRLAAAGIEADAESFAAVAERLGVGGAVRAFAWADALSDAGTATTAEQVADAFETTPGWGRLARQLDPDGTAGLRPGIGWIMRSGSGDHAADETDEDATGLGRPDDPGAHGRSRAGSVGRADRP